LAQVTMISTSMRGSASLASTVCAHRKVGGVGPRGPRGVHLVAVADVGDPDVRREDLRLARSGRGEQGVDLPEHLLGLTLDALAEVVGDLAGDVDHAAVLDGGAEQLVGLMALDAHVGS